MARRTIFYPTAIVRLAPLRKIGEIEPLEDRRLLSAALALEELRGVKFTADLGNFVAIAPATGIEASIAWGDGTASTVKPKADGVEGLDEIEFEVDSTHAYQVAGKYAIAVSVYEPALSSTTAVRVITTFNDTAIVVRGETVLSGTISGKYKSSPLGAGTKYIINGTGTAGDLGAVTVAGDIVLANLSPGSTASGTLTFSSVSTAAGKSGSVTVQFSGPTKPFVYQIVIVSCTGAFFGATGSASVAVKLSGINTFTFAITALPT